MNTSKCTVFQVFLFLGNQVLSLKNHYVFLNLHSQQKWSSSATIFCGTSILGRRCSPSQNKGGQPETLKSHLVCEQFSCNICAETRTCHQQRAALEQPIHHWHEEWASKHQHYRVRLGFSQAPRSSTCDTGWWMPWATTTFCHTQSAYLLRYWIVTSELCEAWNVG